MYLIPFPRNKFSWKTIIPKWGECFRYIILVVRLTRAMAYGKEPWYHRGAATNSSPDFYPTAICPEYHASRVCRMRSAIMGWKPRLCTDSTYFHASVSDRHVSPMDDMSFTAWYTELYYRTLSIIVLLYTYFRFSEETWKVNIL